MLCSSDGGSETEAHGNGNPFHGNVSSTTTYQERMLNGNYEAALLNKFMRRSFTVVDEENSRNLHFSNETSVRSNNKTLLSSILTLLS